MNRNDVVKIDTFSHPIVKEDKVVIWDFDSMIHLCLYSGKDAEGMKNPEYTEKDIDFLQGKLNEMYLGVLNRIEEHYNIIALYCFIKGKNNFRYQLYPEYKSKRPPSSPLMIPLYEYAEVAFKCITSDGAEADDYVYTFSKKVNHNGIVVYVDGDLLQMPSLFYNYQKSEWRKVSEKEAKYHLATKILCGDSGDGVNFSPKIGEAYALKNLDVNFTDYQYVKAIYLGYMKAWKGNSADAKKYARLTYKLLKLHDVS